MELNKDSESILILREDQLPAVMREANLEQRQLLRKMAKREYNFDDNYDSLVDNEFICNGWHVWINRNVDRQEDGFKAIPDLLAEIWNASKNEDEYIGYCFFRDCVNPGAYGNEQIYDDMEAIYPFEPDSPVYLGKAYNLIAETDDAEDLSVPPDPEVLNFAADECRAVIAMSLMSEDIDYINENASEELLEFIKKYRIAHYKNDEGHELWILANMPHDESYPDWDENELVRLFEEMNEADEASGKSVMHIFPHLGPVTSWYGLDEQFVPWKCVYELAYDCFGETSLIYGWVYPEDVPFQLSLQRYIRVREEMGQDGK